MSENYSAAVITVSDLVYEGKDDVSGPLVCNILGMDNIKIAAYDIIPDNRESIEKRLKYYADEQDIALIITIGGTGMAPKKIVPEVTRDVCDRLVPGIPEVIRAESLKHTKRAALSRMEAGTRGRSLIINLPGSSDAIKDTLGAVMSTINVGLDMLRKEVDSMDFNMGPRIG